LKLGTKMRVMTSNFEFNKHRLKIAKDLKGKTNKDLAKILSCTEVTISNYLNENKPSVPDFEKIVRLSESLNLPFSFFNSTFDIQVADEQIFFRSYSRIKAQYRNSARAYSEFAIQTLEYFDKKISNLPAFQGFDIDTLVNEPEKAALTLRGDWQLGVLPIKNIIALLESHGIAVFRLPLEVKEVDAFSFYHDGRPIVFLNTAKSAERMRFDAAHELGHLVLHSDDKNVLENMKDKEHEADKFASSFLMPKEAFVAMAPNNLSLPNLINYKKYWKVSLVAMNYNLHVNGLLTDWHNRRNCIEFSKRGYSKTEPDPIEREKPILLNKIVKVLLEKEGRNFYENLDFGYQILDDISFNLISENIKPKLKLL